MPVSAGRTLTCVAVVVCRCPALIAFPFSLPPTHTAFDLESFRVRLDTQASSLATSADAAAASRRALADATRAFRAAAAPGVAPAAAPLLKRYQTEIDALSTRAADAQAAFLGGYRALFDAPDPAAALAVGRDAAARARRRGRAGRGRDY